MAKTDLSKKMLSLVKDPVQYFKHFLTGKHITAVTFHELWLQFRQDQITKKIKPKFNITDARSAYEVALSEIEQEKVGAAIDSVKHDDEYEEHGLVEKWLKAVTGRVEEAHLVVLKHWLWMVKRAGIREEVIYHIFLILKGSQGSGKSTAVKKLTEPLRAVRIDMNADEIGDPNTYADMNNYLIVVLDELANLSKVDSSKLKKQLTAATNSYRPFYTQKRIKVEKLTSYIGTSNKSITQIFYDNTGMRRFFQLDCQKKVDWDTINNLNYVHLWKSIDENLERGYLNDTTAHIIEKTQKTYVNSEDYEDFLHTHDIEVPEDKFKTVDLTMLFMEYQVFSRSNGYRFQLSKLQFKRNLEALGFSILEKREEETRRRLTYVKVDPRATIKLGDQ